MQYYRTCVLCDTKIRSSYRLCAVHYPLYRDQMDEPWFKALAAEQQIQDDIDRREGYVLPYDSATNIYGQHELTELLSKRNVGRPSTDWRLVERVLRLYDESQGQVELGKSKRVKSLRTLANEVGNKIDHCTVRNILKTYRQKVI